MSEEKHDTVLILVASSSSIVIAISVSFVGILWPFKDAVVMQASIVFEAFAFHVEVITLHYGIIDSRCFL